MFFKNSLQEKLFSSVFIVVTIIILLVTALVTWYEKQRYQQIELNRLYYEIRIIKNRIEQLPFESNYQDLMIVLSNIKSANPNVLYFSLSDMDGEILVADDEQQIGKRTFETATIKNLSTPLFRAGQSDQTKINSGRFEIYHARLNKDLFDRQQKRGRKNESVFDTYWDVTYKGKKLGRIRMGYSGQGLRQHLIFLIGGVLGTSFCVLTVTLLLIYWRLRRGLKPLEEFSNKLSVLYTADSGNTLRSHLETVDFSQTPEEAEEIRQVKGAFLKLKERFVLSWDQLENHRNNLEDMVADRTRKLNETNSQLIHQVEERREIETRLLNVQKMEAIGTLAGGIAHEFNNLFMAITGYASLIQKQVDPGHPGAQKAEKIRELVDNGSESIKQLLGFARGGKYTPGPLNLNEIIRINLEMFRRTRKDIDLVCRYEPHMWSVTADRSQMEHIVMNLLLNASEAMPQNGRLIVESRNIVLHKAQVRLNKIVSGRFVKVSIEDEGAGIDKELIPRIFDPFFTTKPLGAGTGLGLASVYGIVDNHGGFTTVESAKGKGTVFSVFLPAISKKS